MVNRYLVVSLPLLSLLLVGCGDTNTPAAEAPAPLDAEGIADLRINCIGRLGMENAPHAPINARMDACLRYSRASQDPDLRLTAWGMEAVPDVFEDLDHVTFLDLGGNKLTSLPASLGTLKNLRTLYLDGNRFERIPDVVFKLPRLETLYLVDNAIATVDPGINQLNTVREIDLSENHLTTLPESLTGLTQLRSLTLAKNQFTDLPMSLATLPALAYLDISGNRIAELPAGVGRLRTLKGLIASDNRLRGLPEAVAALDNLVFLDVRGNVLSDLPVALTNLPHLNRERPAESGDWPLPLSSAAALWLDGADRLAYASGIDAADNAIETLDPAFCKTGWLRVTGNRLPGEGPACAHDDRQQAPD